MSEILKEEEFNVLKKQAEKIASEMDIIKMRIRELEERKEIKSKIIVRSERCTGCGLCESICPQNAIIVSDIASINEEKCILCERCVNECPNEALEISDFIKGGGEFMPRQDRTGPSGQGSGTGRGMGKGGGRGRMGGFGMGAGGNCICPKCGTKTPHSAGVPCTSAKCPNCGETMTRG